MLCLINQFTAPKGVFTQDDLHKGVTFPRCGCFELADAVPHRDDMAMTGHGGNVFGKDSARPRTLPFRLNVPGPGAYPSHARNQPGPGAYPGFMQAQMMPTQFEFYPEARHEQDTRVQTAARELTAMAMATQARVDADNRAKADALAKYRGMVAAAHAPPKPSTPARPHTVELKESI